MNRIRIYILASALIAIALPAQASVQEFIKCEVNDGKTMADVAKVIADWRKAADKAGYQDYVQETLIPVFSSNLTVGEFFWHGTSPSFERMGGAFDWYFVADVAGEYEPKFADVMTCSSRTLYQAGE